MEDSGLVQTTQECKLCLLIPWERPAVKFLGFLPPSQLSTPRTGNSTWEELWKGGENSPQAKVSVPGMWDIKLPRLQESGAAWDPSEIQSSFPVSQPAAPSWIQNQSHGHQDNVSIPSGSGQCLNPIFSSI